MRKRVRGSNDYWDGGSSKTGIEGQVNRNTHFLFLFLSGCIFEERGSKITDTPDPGTEVPDDTSSQVDSIPSKIVDGEHWVPDWLKAQIFSYVGSFVPPQFSPSGRWAYFKNIRGVDTLFVFDVKDQKSYVAFIGSTTEPIDYEWFEWVEDKKIVFSANRLGSALTTYHMLDVSSITISQDAEELGVVTDLNIPDNILNMPGQFYTSPSGTWLFKPSHNNPFSVPQSDTGIIYNLNTSQQYTIYTHTQTSEGIWVAHNTTPWIGDEKLFMINESNQEMNKLLVGTIDISPITQNRSSLPGAFTEITLPDGIYSRYGRQIQVSPSGKWIWITKQNGLMNQLFNITTEKAFDIIEFRSTLPGPTLAYPWTNDAYMSYTRRITDISTEKWTYEFRLLNMSYITANN